MQSKKILCVDAGYASVGAAVMEFRKFNVPPALQGKWWPVDMVCVQTEKSDRLLALRKQDDFARRVAEGIRELVKLADKHDVAGMVAELPPVGSASPNAMRPLALASGMIAAFAEAYRKPTTGANLLVEWYTPEETRSAAGVPRTVKGQAVKKHVMAWAAVLYPEIDGLFSTVDKKNHVADALSCFEAARHGNLVRMVEAL